MKIKNIRKWMRQYVLDELYQASEFKKEDLVTVEKGKIKKIHDEIALGLREYVKASAKAVIGLNISEMGLSEFKEEFLKTDEDIKTTLLYGYLTQKKVPFEDEYILGREKQGGFKMVDLNLEKINQDDVVDLSEEFEEEIEEMEEDEKEKIRFSEKTKDVKTFISRSKAPEYDLALKKRFGFIPRRRARGEWPSKTPVDRVRIVTHAKTRGGTSKDLYIKFKDKKELDKIMASITPESRENLLARLEKVGDAFQIKMVKASDIFAEYEALEAQLNEAKADYKKDPTAANEMRVNSSLKMIRAWKVNIIKIMISRKPGLSKAEFKKQSKHRYGKNILWAKTKKQKNRRQNKKKKAKKV